VSATILTHCALSLILRKSPDRMANQFPKSCSQRVAFFSARSISASMLGVISWSAIMCMACTALPACHNCECCSQVFTVVHGRSQLFTVVHSCSRLLTVVHGCSRLLTPETGPHSCGRYSRMNRAHNCERCAQLCTVVHGCPRPKPVRNHVMR